jgi:hypothetical protein
MPDQFITEFACEACGHTGHVVWAGAGDLKTILEVSHGLIRHSGTPVTFSCRGCGMAWNHPLEQAS